MGALGKYILQGRLQAIGLTSFLSIFSLLLPALAYLLSGSPVALVTLRRGGIFGFQIIIGSLLLTLLLTYLVQIVPMVAVVYAIVIWMPLWCCAMVLRQTQSQGLMVVTAGMIGLLYILLMHLIFEDVTLMWRTWLEVWIESNLSAAMGGKYKEIMVSSGIDIVPLINAMVASGIVISIITTSLTARWWQSSLFNVGGFRQEFYALRLPRVLCYMCLIGIGVLWLMEQAVLRDLLFMMVLLFLFQGLSAVHRIVNIRKLSIAWLSVMYCLLILMPQMVLFVACIGMADCWFRRVPSPGGSK